MLDQGQTLGGAAVENGEIGDDGGNTARTGQGEGAGWELIVSCGFNAGDEKRLTRQNLGVALLVSVLHGNDDLGLLGVGDQVHGTTDTLNLSGKHEVGEITVLADLEGTEHGEVDLTSADHTEGLLGAEEGSAGVQSDGLLAGVDQVRVLLAGLGVVTKTEDTVLSLQNDFNTRGQVGGSEERNTNTEVDVHAVLEFLGGTLDDTLTAGSGFAVTTSKHLAGVLGVNNLVELLLLGALDDSIDVDTLEVDVLGSDLTNLNNVVSLNDGVLGVLAHGLVEVVLRHAELTVAQTIGLVGLNQSVVTIDRFFQNERLAVEDTSLLGLGHFSHSTILVIPNGEFTSLHYCHLSQPDFAGRTVHLI